jgi:chromosome segregation ATPase
MALNELGVPVVVGLLAEEGDLITALAAEPDKPMDIYTANRVLTEFNKRMNGQIFGRKKEQFTEDLKKQNEFLKEKLNQRNNQRDKDIARHAESVNKQVEQLTQIHKRTVANFDSAIDERKKIEQELNQGLEKCEKELTGAKGEMATQKIEIRDLRSSNSWLQQQVNGLQNQVNNMDRGGGGICIIS